MYTICKILILHFQTSRLIASEVLSRSTPGARASVIEKWAMVADTCRCLHNFNGVLGIITALTCSAIFRLKKSWEKVSKQVRDLFGINSVQLRLLI